MITESTVNIIKEICELSTRSGHDCSEWQIGVTDNAEKFLFEDLGIPRDYRWCIHRRALNPSEAQAILLGFWNIGFQKCVDATDDKKPEALQVIAYLAATTPRKNVTDNALRA